MRLSCSNVRIVIFSPLICWGFCSKKLCTTEPYYKLEVSQKEPLFALLFCFYCSPLGCGWFKHPPSEFTVLFSSETQKQVLKGLTLDSAVSLPLNYLNRCVFAALELTGPPPRWFISPVGLLAAAGDQTEEPGLSHEGNESEKREGRGALLPLNKLSLQPSNSVLPSVRAVYTDASIFWIYKNKKRMHFYLNTSDWTLP